jgi:hypothetical protein
VIHVMNCGSFRGSALCTSLLALVDGRRWGRSRRASRRMSSFIYVLLLVTSACTWRAGAHNEVRRVVEEVEGSLSRGELHTRERRFEACDDYVDTRRILHSSRNGLPRLYIRYTGSKGSSIIWRNYYDTLGRIRFVLIKSDLMGTSTEHRIWISTDGRILKEERSDNRGHTLPIIDSSRREDLEMDPKRAFESRSSCTEILGESF